MDEHGRRQIIWKSDGDIILGDYLPDTYNYLYIRSLARFDNRQNYQYSLDGENFIMIGNPYYVKNGNYRGNMIGFFTYNNVEEKGYIDIDWFDYEISNR